MPSWFVVGQLFGAVALEQMSMNRPLAFRPIILTQWAMMGLMLIILILLPESPWWLVSQGRVEKAAKVLNMFYGHVDGYNVHEQLVSGSQRFALVWKVAYVGDANEVHRMLCRTLSSMSDIQLNGITRRDTGQCSRAEIFFDSS